LARQDVDVECCAYAGEGTAYPFVAAGAALDVKGDRRPLDEQDRAVGPTQFLAADVLATSSGLVPVVEQVRLGSPAGATSVGSRWDGIRSGHPACLSGANGAHSENDHGAQDGVGGEHEQRGCHSVALEVDDVVHGGIGGSRG
jgi:hypothetical protein